jgi:hypothetical protein
MVDLPRRLYCRVCAAVVGSQLVNVTKVKETGLLEWNLGADYIDVQKTSLRDGLKLYGVYRGQFTSRLFLAGTMNVDFNCNQLTDSSGYVVHATRQERPNFQPLVNVPITAGYGVIVYDPKCMPSIALGRGQLYN